MCATSRMSVISLAVLLAGCASTSSPAEDDADIDAGADAGAEPPPDAIDAATPGQLGDDCEWASHCSAELICEPGAGVCAEPPSCTEHGECGRGAHCTGEGVCAVSAGHSPCGDDDDCAAKDACVGGACGCRGERVEASLRDVNMLIVLDRSGSMWQDTSGQSNVPWEETKWYIAITAIDTLLATVADSIHFGLVVFPHADASHCSGCDDPEACLPGNVLVDVDRDTGDAIRDELDAILPHCCTPTGATLASYVGHESLADPDADNYVLLVADGMETCGGDAVSAAEALRAQDPPVRTFAVGFGGAVDPEELSGIAEAGGTARDGDPAYYQADDREALGEALSDIAVEAFSCVHSVDGPRLDESALAVYVDGQALPRDPSREDGWAYEPERNELSFHGPICEALRSGAVDELSYVQTCDLVVD